MAKITKATQIKLLMDDEQKSKTAKAISTTPKVTSGSVSPTSIQSAKALLTPKTVVSSSISPTTIPTPNNVTPIVPNTVKTGSEKPRLIPNAAATTKPEQLPIASYVKPTVTKLPYVPKSDAIKSVEIVPETITETTKIADITGKPMYEQTQSTYEPVQPYASITPLQSQSQSSTSDIEARINALNLAKQEQAVANLGKARDTQLSNLASEEAGIKPLYYDKRNAAAASNLMSRRTLAEELAARGESKSGVADEANIRANMSLQGEQGLLNRQEASNLSDIASRRTGVQNAYESDVVSAKAGLDAVAMQNLIDQYNADRQFKLSEAGLTGTYNGNQTLQAQNQSFNQNMATKQFDQAKTQQDIDNIFRQTQADIGNALNNRQITNQEAQQLLDNLFRDKTFAEQTRQFNVGFNYQKQRDSVSDSQWQQSIDLDLRRQTFNETQTQIENALAQNRISQEDASQALQWARFNAEQDPNSLDNQLKKANIDLNTYTKNASALNDIIQRLDGLYTYKDVNGVPTRNPNYSDAQLRGAIIGLNLSDDQTDTLLLRYGLPIN